MSSRTGYCITTLRLRLRCGHPEWLFLTQELFNQIELFYYQLFLEHKELWGETSQEILRQLEMLSLPGKERRLPESPLPWENIPPYFRRAAVNAGIAAAKSRMRKGKLTDGKRVKKLNSAMVFYKRMYKNFSQKEITLKLWDGSRWQWMRCRLYGRNFPEGGELMSPSVVFDRNFIMLHVPVKETTRDASSVRSRIKEGRNICGLQFAGGDIACVGSVFDQDGKELGVRFFRGGNAYSHRCRMVLERMEKSRKSMGGGTEAGQNRKYWIHLAHLTDSYAHEVSRKIVQFCQEKDVSVIAIAKETEETVGNAGRSPEKSSERSAGKSSEENLEKNAAKSSKKSPEKISSEDGVENVDVKNRKTMEMLHAEHKMREFLHYKAWKAGIVVIEFLPDHTDDVCALCGSAITETGKTSGEFVCGNGHHGNRSLNAARKLALNCRMQFGK